MPAHDSRDLAFAEKFQLPVLKVVQAPEGQDSIGYTGLGTSVNSGFLDGMATPDAKLAMIQWLEESGHGRRHINFKLEIGFSAGSDSGGNHSPLWKKGGTHR